jgi:hypothetical protein
MLKDIAASDVAIAKPAMRLSVLRWVGGETWPGVHRAPSPVRRSLDCVQSSYFGNVISLSTSKSTAVAPESRGPCFDNNAGLVSKTGCCLTRHPAHQWRHRDKRLECTSPRIRTHRTPCPFGRHDPPILDASVLLVALLPAKHACPRAFSLRNIGGLSMIRQRDPR